MTNYLAKRNLNSTPIPSSIEKLERAIYSSLSQENLQLACEYLSKRLKISADQNTPKEIEIQKIFKNFYRKFKEKLTKFIENENYEEAISSIKILDKLICFNAEVNLTNERLDLLNNMAVAYRKSNRTNAANDVVDKALELFSIPKVLKETKTSILLNKCSILSSQGKHKEALLYSDKAKALAKSDYIDHKNSEKPQQITLLAVAYHNSGVENEHLGNIQKALHNYKKSIDLLSANGTKEHLQMLNTFKKFFEEVSKLHSFHKTKHSRELSFPNSDKNSVKDHSRKRAKSSSRGNLKSASTNNLVQKNRADNVSPFSIENLWDQSEISETSRSNGLFEKPPINRGTARVRGGRRKFLVESRASSSKNSNESSEIEKPYIISRDSSRKNSYGSSNSSKPKPGTIFRIGQSSSTSRLPESDVVTQRETCEEIDSFYAKQAQDFVIEEKAIFEPEKQKEIPTIKYEMPKFFELNEEIPALSISQDKNSYIEKNKSNSKKNRESSNEIAKTKNLLETLRLENSDIKINSSKNEMPPSFTFHAKSSPRTQLKIPDLSSSRSDSFEIKTQEPITAEPIKTNTSIINNMEMQKIEVFNRQETKKFKLQPKIFKRENKKIVTKEDLEKMKKAAILIQKHFRRHKAEDLFNICKKYQKQQKILLKTCRKIQNTFYNITIFQNKNLISAKASEVGKFTNELIYTVPENIKISPRELADRLDIDGYHALYMPEKEINNSDNIRWTMITRIMKRVQDAGYLFQFYLNEHNSKLMIKAHELGKNLEICSVFEEDITHFNEQDLIKYLNTEILERIDIQNERIILNPKIENSGNKLPNLNEFDESKIVKIQRLFRKKQSSSKSKAEAEPANAQPNGFIADFLKSQAVKELKFNKFGFSEENEDNADLNFPIPQFPAQNEEESSPEIEKARKFARPQIELLTDDLLIRSQKVFFNCTYLINLYKEVMKGNEYIRVEAFPTKKLPKPMMAMVKLREICEILELWENSEVYDHKEQLLKYIDLKQGKVIIANQPVSDPVNKELLFTGEKKLKTNFNYQVTFYEIDSDEISEKVLIEAATLQEVIPIHIYLSISKEEIAETLEINVKDAYKHLDKLADLLCLENSELRIDKKKSSKLPPAILISLPSIRSYINASNSSIKAGKTESPKLPEIPSTTTIPCPTQNTLKIPSIKKKKSEKHENVQIPREKLISMEEKSALIIQKFIRAKNARELRKLLSMKNYRENHNKILGRGVRFLNNIPYMITIFSTKKGILVEVRDMERGNLLEKIIDPSSYIFGFSKCKNIKMIIDSLAISNGKLAFLRNYKRHEKINVQNKDYSFFENAVDEGLSLETATLRLQKWMRIVLAKRLLIRKRNEASKKLIINKKKTIGGEDYMVSIFQTPTNYIVEVYSLNKPKKNSQWMYTRNYSLEDLKKIYGDIDTENIFREIEIQNKKLVLIKPKYFGGGSYSKVQKNRGSTSRIDESSNSFCSISDEKLIMSQERILNFKKCIVNIGLDKRYNQKANKESEMIIFDVAPVSDALSRKQLSVDINTASDKVGIPTQWLIPLCKYLLDNCLQVGEYSINLNMDVPKMDINLMATKIQRAYRGWRIRKMIGKIIKDSDGRLIAMHKKNIHGKIYFIYAYAQNKRIKIEAECGKETVAMYLDAEILKSIGDTTRKKFLETKIFPFIGIHDQGILRKLYFEKRNTAANTNLPMTSSQSVLKTEPDPQKTLNLPNISKNPKNLSQAISYFNKATERAKLENSGDVIKRKGQNPRQKDDKKNSREEMKYSRSGSSVNQSLSSSRNINSSVTNTFYLSEPPKLIFQTVSSINRRQLTISLYSSPDGILVETVDSKNRKLSLQLEASIPSNTPEEVIERICRDIIARLYIDKSTGDEMLVLGQGEVIYKKRQIISDRSFLVSGIKRHDGITLSAFDPGSKQILECKIGKSVWNEENLQEELEKVMKKLKVVKILGDDALILN